MNKKLLFRLVALVAAMMCALGASAYDFYSGGIYYNITGSNTVEVTYNTGYNSYSGYVKIPRSVTYNNTTYTVTAIGEYAFFLSALTSVSIPNTVTMIKEGGISTTSLTRVIIPNSVAIIDQNAFCNCDDLTDIILGSGVTYIGDHAFGFGEYDDPQFVFPTQTVLCTASTPPVFGFMYGADDSEYSSDNELWDAFWTRKSLYVANNSLSRYYTATGWRLFSDIDTESCYYAKSILDDGSYGSINFFNVGNYSWFINSTSDDSYAQSGNAGATSSTSTLAATITVQEDAILSFDFKAWGEGTSYDKCIFTVDGVQQFSYGNRDNDWESYYVELSAGTHRVTWSFDKDGSVDGTGDFFAIDHVKVSKNVTEAYACYTSSNTMLTFYYDNLRGTRTGTTYDLNDGSSVPGWKTDGTSANVTKVVFNSSFAGARPISARAWFSTMTNLTSITGISYLNTENMTNMSAMFYGCSGLTSINVSKFNTAKVTTMLTMFNGCSGLTSLDLSNFNTSKVTNMNNMFNGCSNLKTVYAGSGWTTNAVTSSTDMFMNCTKLVGGQGTTYSSSHVDKAYAHIDGGTSNPGYFTEKKEAYAVYTPSNTTLTFYYDTERSSRSGTTYDLNGNNAPGWRSDGTNANVTKVVFNSSFAGARPTSTYQWFSSMTNLTSITGLSYLNTENVTTMQSMFFNCNKLTSLDVSGFNTSNVTDMLGVFNNCSGLTRLDVTRFNTSKVTSMGNMFAGCTGLTNIDLSNFSTSKVTNMKYMFYGCTNLTTIYAGSGWTTNAVTQSSEMFYNCTKLVGGQGTTYNSSHIDKAYAHIDGGTSNPGYFSEKPAYMRGDVNGDGSVNISDVTALIDYLLSGDASSINLDNADCNQDSLVNISDVTTLIDYLLSGSWN